MSRECKQLANRQAVDRDPQYTTEPLETVLHYGPFQREVGRATRHG